MKLVPHGSKSVSIFFVDVSWTFISMASLMRGSDGSYNDCLVEVNTILISVECLAIADH